MEKTSTVRKLKNINKFLIFLLVLLIPLIELNSNGKYLNKIDSALQELNSEFNDLRISDVAGTDFYAEQISAYIAGSESIIRQSLFTNDTNLLPHFDISDYAFYKINIFISASNGIRPKMFPTVLNDNIIGSSMTLNYNSFLGFLYYDKELTPEDAKTRAERALDIIKRKFKIDLFMVNSTDGNFFPFVGYYPDWDVFFQETIQNLPKDGYWKALDINRLKSEVYLKNYHLSASYVLINSLELLEGDIDVSTDQMDFNFDDINTAYSQFNLALAQYGVLSESDTFMGALANETLSEGEMELINEVASGLVLENDSHYTTLMIQYEGKSEGIEKIEENQYKFDLFSALGYDGEELHPSEKVFINLNGAYMSVIDINVLGTDIVDMTPKYFDFNEYLIEQISMMLYYAESDLDARTLKDYSFELYWMNEEGIFTSFAKPVNLNDPDDLVNNLDQYGMHGFPYIPTGLLNPINEFIITYNVSYSEPNLIITKKIIGENASYGAYRTFSLNITAENIGNKTVWGVPSNAEMDLEVLLSNFFGEDAEDIYNALWDYIRFDPRYKGQYNSLEEFVGMTEKPRIFQFDSLGSGAIDYWYPDNPNAPSDPTNTMPYSPEMVGVIDDLVAEGNLTYIEGEILKVLFTNNESIWYRGNWMLNVTQKLSYLIENLDLSTIDSFTTFYNYSFVIKDTFPELPAVIWGNQIGGTNSSMALNNDTESWIIESEQNYVDKQDLEIHFRFENNSEIDIINKPIERVSIILNFTGYYDLDFEIWNDASEEFQIVNRDSTSLYNNSWTFTFTRNNNNNSLMWLFDDAAPDNYTLLFKIKGSETDKFNISIDFIYIELATRDVNSVNQSGAISYYSTDSGNTKYHKTSNTLSFSNYDMASIIAFANVSIYNSSLGELNNYTLRFKNIGSDIAYNVSITLKIPGIMNNTNNFTLKDNILYYNLSQLAPSKEIIVSFTFYTPNSASINDVEIIYNNSVTIDGGNSSSLTSMPNEVYISTPVDYKSRFPYLRTIEINLTSTNYSPAINSDFNLTVHIKNEGLKLIYDLNLTMNDYYGNLIRIDNNSRLSLTNIKCDEGKTLNITLRKTNWKGYFYPSINNIKGSESRTIQIVKSPELLLGNINFEIIKTADKKQVEKDDNITITVKVINTGNICIKNIIVSDLISFTQIEFSLVQGKLVNVISSLDPGESVTFKYKIKAMSQAFVILKPAQIEFYFLHLNEVYSNEIEIKIDEPKFVIYSLMIIPAIIALVILIGSIRKSHKYKESKYEHIRSDKSIFRLDFKDVIFKADNTLKARLIILSKSMPISKKDKIQNSVNSEIEKKKE